MPELPEVETIRRSLARNLVGRRIAGCSVAERRLRMRVPAARLRRLLPGRRVLALKRRAKYLLVELEGDLVLLFHLGMSGRLLLEDAAAARQAHTHVVIALDDRRELRFVDPRRFGLVDLLPRAALAGDRRLRSLGAEPLSAVCDGAYLLGRAHGLRKPIKNFLMDARHIVGVGNIYASEALFVAGIHPLRAAGSLSRARWERLAGALKAVLDEAIRQGGTTLNDFRDADGRRGAFQARLRVYGRDGGACQRCGRRVRRVVQAGRATFYCGSCQR